MTAFRNHRLGSLTVVLAAAVAAFAIACQPAPHPEVDPFGPQLAIDCGVKKAAGYAGPFEAKELSGTVVSGGSVFADAEVVAQNKNTGEILRTKTDARGRFSFRNSGRGTFEVYTCKPGSSSMQFTVAVSPYFSATNFIVTVPEQPPQ